MAVFKSVQCPSCGGPRDITNPAAMQATCEYCSTVFLFDEDGVRDTGKKARLMPAISGLKIGTKGKLHGKDFEVLGRVQYKYYNDSQDLVLGHWDEWYVQFIDESVGESTAQYISEDMGELIFQTKVEAEIPEIADVSARSSLVIKEQQYIVTERGIAHCNGTEGELPFVVIPEDHYPFINAVAVNDNKFISVELEEEGASYFIGEVIDKSEIEYSKEIQAQEEKKSSAFRCPSCGSPLNVENIETQEFTVRCESCTTVSTFSENVGKALGKCPLTDKDAQFCLPLSATGTLRSVEYTIIGRIARKWEDYGEAGLNYEYLLYNEIDGYSWLGEEEGGHWYLSNMAKQKPADTIVSASIPPKQNIAIGNEKYKFYEAGSTTLVYVDGIMPWTAILNERVAYADVINPPFVFSEEHLYGAENQIREVEFSLGEYIPHDEVASAFGVELNPPIGVGAGQPVAENKLHGIISKVSMALAFVFLVTSSWFSCKGDNIMHYDVKLQNIKKVESLSKPFLIKEDGQTIEINVGHNLTNQWATVAVGLVDAQQKMVIADESIDVQYYAGVEDGESWSEGSRKNSFYWKIKKAGEYKILTAVSDTNAIEGNIDIEVRKDIYIMFGPIFGSIIWLALAFYIGKQKNKLEEERWENVMDDDDDDDDDYDY